MNVNSLRTNASLQKEEWLLFDTAVLEEATIRLGGVADLIAAGLTFNLPNAMGTTVLQWEDINELNAAERSMDGINRALYDLPDYQSNNLPIYITHKDFRLNIRHLEASRTLGQTIDTTTIQLATRKVAESLDDALFNGGALTFDGNSVPGYTTHTNRNTGTISNAWDGTATGEQVLADVIAMIAAEHGDRMFGPYILYINSTYAVQGMLEDFKANSDKTVMARLLEIDAISAIRVSDQLSATEVVLIQMTKDVVDLVTGEDIRTVEWGEHGGFQLNFKVLAIQVPRIKATQANRSGIAHYSE
jgi:uncharacterized linocin/CFP29 family protein